VRKRRPAYEGNGGRDFGQLSRQPLDARSGDTSDLFDLRGGEVSQAGRPALDERPGPAAGAGRAQLGAHDYVRKTERQDAFGPRLHWNPLIRVRAGLRHPRFDLHEDAADARTPLPHLAVAISL
jgi:hypothetical protein